MTKIKEKRLKKNLDKMEEIDKDEKGTRYFYQKVRMENKKETIETLLEEKDSESEGEERVMNETSKPEEMKETARMFYERLWRKRKVSNRQLTNLLKGVSRKLSEEQKESCEGEITIEELRETKKSMAKGKTGGVDGIPAEFWLMFDMDEWLVKVFNETIRRKRMSDTMRIAVVKLISKKGSKKKMSNYRPISLLCTDYKLMANIVTARMKPVLNSMIKNDQQGFIKDGDITGNLILVKEIIEYCDETETEAALILMDFKKAYDRVSREAMIRVLREMNFGEFFIQMVETLYEEVGAKVEVNGQLTEEVGTGGGVRQGCPLSP